MKYQRVSRGERGVSGVGFSGHVCEGSRGGEEALGRYGVKERNMEAQMVVDFVEDGNGCGEYTQVDSILCSRRLQGCFKGQCS